MKIITTLELGVIPLLVVVHNKVHLPKSNPCPISVAKDYIIYSLEI
jgi:hypothetical protein